MGTKMLNMLGTTTRPRLVAIEDQAIVQDLLIGGLAARGYEVAIARDAGAALDLLRQQPAAAVLLDTSMRLDEAWAFACTVRHLGHQRYQGQAVAPPPVIAFSAFGGAADRAAQVDVDDVLPQALMEPCAIEALADVVARHVVPQQVRPALAPADRARLFDVRGMFGFAARCLSGVAAGAARGGEAFAYAGGAGHLAGGSTLQPSHM
jgi:CheY-like chemotaxis protein